MDESDILDDIVITKKEGLVVQSKMTYTKVFETLLGIITNANDTTARIDMIALVKEVRDGLIILFEENTGIFRLTSWIEKAEKMPNKDFTKQTAISLIREFYPLSGEIARDIYEAWGLDRLDQLIVKGIPDWELQPQTQLATPTSPPAIRSSPYGIVEQIKRRREL